MLVVAAAAVFSTSTVLLAQVTEDQAEGGPVEEVQMDVPPQERQEEHMDGEQVQEHQEEKPVQDAVGAEEDGSDARESDAPERPLRIRGEERDRLEEESQQQESIGRNIERQREAAVDAGEEIPDFEVMRAQAEAQLFQAAETHPAPGVQPGEVGGSEASVCFRTDGSVTSSRVECDPDQGRHFGIQEESVHGAEGGFPDDAGYAPPSDDLMQEHMEDRFGEMTIPSGDLLSIVTEALDRLSAMIVNMQGNPAALAKIQQTMNFLSGILRQYGSGQTPPPPDIGEQIHARLGEIMQAVSGPGGSSGPGGPGGPGGFGSPDMGRILGMMEKMIGKLPQVFAIFEGAGIPVPQEARDAAAEATETFNRLREPCASGDMQSCMQLGEVMKGIEQRMRPPMEAAMQQYPEKGFEVGMRIHALMSEGMEDMDPPPGMMDRNYGPPSGMMEQGYGPPPGMRDGNYGPRPDMMNQGYRPRPGTMEGPYGSPSGSWEGHDGPPPEMMDAGYVPLPGMMDSYDSPPPEFHDSQHQDGT